jgi:hypothetical protein
MKKIISKIINLVVAYRFIIIWLLLLLIFGITLFKMLKISNYKSDEVYLEQQKEELQVKRIRINKDLVEKLQALEETPVNVQPKRLGTEDPFRP